MEFYREQLTQTEKEYNIVKGGGGLNTSSIGKIDTSAAANESVE